MSTTYTIPAGELTPAVQYVAQWLDSRPTVPIHGGLLFRNGADGLEIAGYGENATARAVIDGVAGDPGAFVVAGRLVAALAETLPAKPITVTVDGARVSMVAGSARITLPTMSAEDFPGLRALPPRAGVIDGATLAAAVKLVTVAARTDPGKDGGMISMTGVNLRLGDGDRPDVVRMLATDRYRATLYEVPWQRDSGADVRRSHVPVSVLTAAGPAFASGAVEIRWSEGSFGLSGPNRSITSRTLDDRDFPLRQLSGLAAVRRETAVTLFADEILPSIKQTLALVRAADQRPHAPLYLHFIDGVLELFTEDTEDGASARAVEVDYDGPEATIKVSAAKLRDALTSAPGGAPRMAFTPGQPTGSLVFTSPDDPDWHHLMQPLR